MLDALQPVEELPAAVKRDGPHFFLDSPADYSYISPPRTDDSGANGSITS
jgi:hypothetical protein